MARWDEILSLPVQSPPTLEFSASDLTWSKVEGWRDAIDRVALIPFSRVDDFVRGESANKECPTRFHVEARRRRPPQMPYKQKVDGIIEYILYWCSFGPDDHRKGGIIRPSRVYHAKRKTAAGRPNTKRGCVCHFIVKRLIAEPTVALIIYNQDKHVDKKGQPCHGPLDEKAVGTRAMYAPYISDELRLRVLSLLYVGVPVETIMQRHTETVEKQGGPTNRDDLLTHRYVRRLERSIRRFSYEVDVDDAVSTRKWVDSHRNHIFYYEDFTDLDPVVVGIQTDWQLQQMISFGNRSLIALDSSIGPNKLKYSVQSLVVFNESNKAIPVAWIIAPFSASVEAYKWMRALYEKVHSKDPSWKLAGFIVDLPSADVLTIREVFQCSVLLSYWRVRHSWHKNLVGKCSDTELCVEMSRRLGQAIDDVCQRNGDFDLFQKFAEDFVDCVEFLDHFVAVWLPKLGMWISKLKMLPIASQETCAAMEFYHHQLKLRLLNEKDQSVYQRLDWLVHKLGTKVHSYYWLDEYPRKDDFARYQKDEWMSGLTFWQRALEIPDTDVCLEQQCAKVIDQDDRQRTHLVWNPGTDFAICDCEWSRMGYLCKHVVKVSQVCRRKGLVPLSTSVFKYNQMLLDLLHCAPYDSLIRDHAVSLAVSVQMQLNTILNEGKDYQSQSSMMPMEHPSFNEEGGSSNSGHGTINENLVINKDNGRLTTDESADNAKEISIQTPMDIDFVPDHMPLNESMSIVEEHNLGNTSMENMQKITMSMPDSLLVAAEGDTNDIAACNLVSKVAEWIDGANVKEFVDYSTAIGNEAQNGEEVNMINEVGASAFVFTNEEIQNDGRVSILEKDMVDILHAENDIAGIAEADSSHSSRSVSDLCDEGQKNIIDCPHENGLVCFDDDVPTDVGVGDLVPGLHINENGNDNINDGNVLCISEDKVLINGANNNAAKTLHKPLNIELLVDSKLEGFRHEKMDHAASENGVHSSLFC